MKRIYIILAILGFGLSSCNDINDYNDMTPDEKYSTEIESLITTQNGKFNSDELYSKLTSSVLILDQSIYHYHNGEVSTTLMLESDEPQTTKFLFFKDNKYWACYDIIEMPGSFFSAEPSSLKNDWNYNLENNELTVVMSKIFNNYSCEAKSKVVYFDGSTMITRGNFNIHDYMFKEVVNIFKFDAERATAEEKYKSDIVIE